MSADRGYVRAWLGYLFDDAVDLPAFVRWSWWPKPGDRHPLTAGAPVADLDRAADELVRLADAGAAVYVRQTLTGTAPSSPADRGGADDTAFVTHLWCDLDVAGPRHAPADGEVLPPGPEVAESIADALLPMSAVLDSVGGLYGMWKLTEPVDVRDPAERAKVRAALTRFDRALVAEGKRRGYHVDAHVLDDLARILRPAGVTSPKVHKATGEVSTGLVTVRRGWALGAGPYDFGELAALGIDAPPRHEKERPTLAARPATSGGESPLEALNRLVTLGQVLDLDRRFGPWTYEGEWGGYEHYLRAGSSSVDSVRQSTTDGWVVVWSSTVAPAIGVEAGKAMTLASFMCALLGVAPEDFARDALRRARELRQGVTP